MRKAFSITQTDHFGKIIPNNIEKENVCHIDEIKACCVVGVKELNSIQLKVTIVLYEETRDIFQIKEKTWIFTKERCSQYYI